MLGEVVYVRGDGLRRERRGVWAERTTLPWPSCPLRLSPSLPRSWPGAHLVGGRLPSELAVKLRTGVELYDDALGAMQTALRLEPAV